MESIIVEFTTKEKAALEALAQKSKCTLKEIIERLAVTGAVKENLLQESAERNGWKVTRLDE